MNSLRKIFRRVRTLLWTALTLLTVLAAVVVGIGKLLMPYSVHYQPELESWLSKAFNQPVKVESFTGEWKAFGPRISLLGVTLMPEGIQNEIAINHAALDIKPLNALIPGRPLYSFRIIGADLSLERTTDGRYVLSGLGVSNRSSGKNRNPGLRNVALNGEVRLQDVSLSFDDPEREIHMVLSNVNGRLKLDGSRMAAEIQARLSDSESQRIVGDLEATIRVTLDEEQHVAAASWHVKTGELMMAELVRQLPHHPLVPASGWLNAELWGEWQQDRPQKMQGVLDLRDAQLSSESGPLVIDHLNSRLNFEFVQRKNWRMDLSDLTITSAGVQWQSQKLSVARNIANNLGLWVSADFLDLDLPLQLTQRIMASYNITWPAAIPRRAQGSIADFDLLLNDSWRLMKVGGRLSEGHFWDWEKGPDIAGINAQIAIDGGIGEIQFEGRSVRLDWPRIFRRPVSLELVDCRAEFIWSPGRNWQFDLNRCRTHNLDISIVSRVRLASSEGKPVVDINVAMERGDVSRFGDYWPENIMTDRTRHWLRTSLLNGRVVNGRYSMQGDMDDFPFADHSGRIQAIVQLEDAKLKYADYWPQLENIDATVHFEGTGMLARGRVGNTGGAVVDLVTASIGNFKQAVLEVEYQTATDLPRLTGFLKRTPLLDGLAMDPDQFVLEGRSDISGHLRSTLGKDSIPMQVTGVVNLQDARFTEQSSGIVLNVMNGALEFDREGLKGSELTTAYKENPVTLDVLADWDANEVFRATVHGDLPLQDVIPDNLLKSEPMFSRASGTSRWEISVSAAEQQAGEARETWLEMYSSLEGITFALPAPLDKSADESWPLSLRYPIRTPTRMLSVDMPGHIQVKMELAEDDASPVRAAAYLGEDVSELPTEGLFVINCSTALLDLDGWLDLIVDRFSQTEDVGGLELESASVDAEQVMIFNRLFDDVALIMQYEDDVIRADFDGRDIEGLVKYYKNDEGAHSMTGEFERLLMPDPIAEGMTMESNPADLPEMHFFAKEFSYLGLELGETRIEGYPLQDGFHLDSIEAQSPRLVFSARGDWIKSDEGARSDFDIYMTSESLGTVLEAMDISSAMQGGQTVVHFDAWWEGPPAAFALERLNGEMDISIVQGNILTADPGAGRMLGLLSLTELPRRLAMDFRDVFGDGFSFDEATGTMRLENGTSYTDDLILSSTAAEIAITGDTDLVDQIFNYEFTIRPGVSKSLPVIGAIAGGPVGAAAGLALQALLRDSLGEAAEARYTIRGPWSDPEVERVEPSAVPDMIGENADGGVQPPEIERGSDSGAQTATEAGTEAEKFTEKGSGMVMETITDESSDTQQEPVDADGTGGDEND